MTTGQFYKHFLDELTFIYEEREAINIADWVFENITRLKKWERRESLQKLSNELLSQLSQCLHELLQHKPVQYVLNEAWFYKMKFFVNEDVLIPRPETEQLVTCVINDLTSRTDRLDVLDIGTGSGCVAISLKKELENLNLTALDISEKALFVAKKNAYSMETPVHLVNLNFLDENAWELLGRYDVIVSNPPYIPQREKEILSKNVRDFEPGIALFVQDNSPFIFYDSIAKFAQTHLKSSGKIYVEIHENYANEVLEIFTG
ncbi:MAG: peptide chain release factor N(5)-glutamine methyltransferase, partial [Ginsengibacter sp.]